MDNQPMTSDRAYAPSQPTNWDSPEMQGRIRSRYRKERRFRLYGISALILATTFLVALLITITGNGVSGMFQTYIKLDINFSETIIGDIPLVDNQVARDRHLARINYTRMINTALYKQFPSVTTRAEKRRLRSLISSSASLKLKDMLATDPSLKGQTRTVWLLASDDVDQLKKGSIDPALPEKDRRVKDREISWINNLAALGAIDIQFHTDFFTRGDSTDPENVGIKGALVGTALTLLVTIAIAFPLGVFAAIYLEEFAPQNRFTAFVEVNINNLAAVPSIVFGLLGLSLFLGVMDLPRSAPLVGGMTLSLMTLPTIIIAARAAIRGVPQSIRDAALALGASKTQMVFHHVMPVAMPGIMTGTLLGMSQALGETAPLLMIGMAAFVVDIPQSIMDAGTVLPVQIFMWANNPERLFIEKTAAAILVLLAFLITMNALAIWLREKFERDWS